MKKIQITKDIKRLINDKLDVKVRITDIQIKTNSNAFRSDKMSIHFMGIINNEYVKILSIENIDFVPGMDIDLDIDDANFTSNLNDIINLTYE